MVRIHAAALPRAWAQISSGGNGVSAASDTELSFLFQNFLRFLARRRLQHSKRTGTQASPTRVICCGRLPFGSGSLESIVSLFTQARRICVLRSSLDSQLILSLFSARSHSALVEV